MNLNKEEVITLINKYPIGNVIGYKRALEGLGNYNWIIETTKGKFVLRCIPFWKMTKGLEFEFKYLDYFRKRFSKKIPKPLENNNHQLMTRYKNKRFWIYELIKGKTILDYSKNQLREAAKLIAEFHNILVKSGLDNGRKVTSPRNPYISNALVTQRKRASSRKHKNDIIFLSEVDDLIEIYKQIRPKDYFALKAYPLHKDLKLDNVIFKNGHVVGLIDFDQVSYNKEPLIKDVTNFLYYCRSKRDRKKMDLESAKFFIKKYKKYRNLSDKEIALIPYLEASNSIEDFSFTQWLFENDKKRARLYKLKLYSNMAKWYWNNKEFIIKTLSE